MDHMIITHNMLLTHEPYQPYNIKNQGKKIKGSV